MRQLLFLFAITLFFISPNQAAIWYVNASAAGTNTGTSWMNACTDIGSAISNSNGGDEIWVAAGTYKPSATNQSVYYNLKADVSIYGGFNGTETLLNQRNFTTNVTNISGDIGTLGFPNDNTYHLFKAYNLNILAIVDGFRIRDGIAYYTGLPHTYGYQGGAAVIEFSLVKFANCTFNNHTAQAGGAIYATSSNLTIEACSFRGNIASFTNGGAIYSHNSNLNITQTNFTSNSTTAGSGAADGGAIYMNGAIPPISVTIDRCFFSNNSSLLKGSSISAFSYSGTINILNCLLVGNYSKYGSVIELIGTSSPSLPSAARISNCSIAYNSADTNLLTSHPIQLTATSKKIENSILWDNTSTSQLDTGYIVKNCLIEGGYSTGTNIINVNPNFNQAPTFNNLPFVGTIDDYKLNIISLAVDAGDNLYVNTAFDLNDSVRIQNGDVDLGAIETTYCNLPFTLNVSPNDTLCTGQIISITASTGNVFLWNTGITANSISTNTSGTYSVLAIDTISQCRGENATQVYFLPPIIQNIPVNLCYNSSYTFPSGITLNHIVSNLSDTSYFSAINGCDSLAIVQINILPAYNINQNISICSGSNYTFPDGTIQTNILVPVIYTSIFSSINGCDSLITTSFQLNATYSSTIVDSVCSGGYYTFPDGTSVGPLYSSTSNTSNLSTISGCDSIIQTTLIINTIDTSVIQSAGPILTANASGLTYQWLWCDFQSIVPGATNQSFTPGWNGSYAVIISNGTCKDTSNCHPLGGVSINEIILNDIAIYPNPFGDEIVIELKRNASKLNEVSLTTALGMKVYKESISTTTIGNTLKLKTNTLSSGIYFIHLLFDDGSKMSKKIIKK